MTTTIVNPNGGNSAHSPLIPDYKLHWYQIRSVLGRGGFGITYLADDLNLQKQVAIKEYFPTEFAYRDSGATVAPSSAANKSTYEWGLDRFISEARTLSKFDHPNIVKVHAVFEENDTGYMVMSYEEGHSLQSMLDEGQVLNEAALLGIVRPLLGGLQAVHNHNFIHRDIKPDNIFIRTDGTPVLLDFGSARQSLAGETADMTVLVTPGYAPVEQYFANREGQGPWTDIYGLGATLYRAVTGDLLTNAVERSHSERSNSTEVRQTVDHSAKLKAGIDYSSPFIDAIEHAIKVDAADRPQSVADWLNELPDTAPLPHADSNSGTASKRGSGALVLGCVTALIVVAFVGYRYLAAQQDIQIPPVVQSVDEPTNVDRLAPKSSTTGRATADAPDKVAAMPASEPQQNVTVTPDINAAAQTEAATAAALRLEQARLDLLAEQEAIDRQNRLDIIAKAKNLKEAERQQAAEAERQRLKRIAAEQEKEEERRLNAKIEASAVLIAARSGATPDTLEYLESSIHTNLVDLKNRQLTTTINAKTDEWQDSGVMLIKGRTYRLTAVGSWKMAAICRKSDASGEGIYRRLCVDLNLEIIKRYSLGALIAKIGKQPLPFFVGKEFEFTANENAPLFLRSNDAPKLTSDNTGTLEVTVELISEG